MKYTLIIFLILSVLMNIGCSYENNVQTTVAQLPEKEDDSTVYIKKMTWGLTGDKRIVVISHNPTKEFTPDPSSEYVYEGLFTMFYKIGKDTLYVYAPIAVAIPERFKSAYVVVQKELGNPEMMDLLNREKYRKLGLVEL